MGHFSDHFRTEHAGSATEIETRAENRFLGIYRDALFIDNRRVEDIRGTIGTFTRRGRPPAPDGAAGSPVVVRIRQGLFGTRAYLAVEGTFRRMHRAG